MQQHYRLASGPSAFSSCELGGVTFATRCERFQETLRSAPEGLELVELGAAADDVDGLDTLAFGVLDELRIKEG